MEFSRQEYWSGLPFPSPGDLPDPGIKSSSPALLDGSFTTSATWEAAAVTYGTKNQKAKDFSTKQQPGHISLKLY